MVGAHLQFSNLPLARVDLRLVLTEDLLLDAPGILFIGQELRERLPVPLRLGQLEQAPGIDRPISSSMATVASVGFGADPPAVLLIVQQNMLICRWMRLSGLDEEKQMYPGFDHLLELLKWAVNVFEKVGVPLQFAVANMSYLNFDSEARLGSEDYFSSDVMKVDVAIGNPIEINVNWRDGDTDYRALISHGREIENNVVTEGWQITNSCGKPVTPADDPFTSLVECHDVLIKNFTTVISRKALEKWGYKNA